MNTIESINNAFKNCRVSKKELETLPKQNFIYMTWNNTNWNYSINVCEYSKETNLYNIGVIGWVSANMLIKYLKINDLKIANPNIEYTKESNYFDIDILTNSQLYNESINIRSKKDILNIMVKNKNTFIPTYYENI